jgi:DNA-binding transcriptional LysR family regulator
MLDFVLLRAFVAVADCGGFHRAAERLNLTQSTISQQIKRLELETNRPLFRRTTRSVALTDDGEMLLGDARRLLQLEEAARHRLAAPRLSGMVRLGVVEEVAGGSLPSALSRFANMHPGVKLEVQIGVSAELIGQFDKGRLDVVFAKRPFGTSRDALSGANPWSGPRPIRFISSPTQRCRWRSIASGRYRARRRLPHSMTANELGRSSTPAPA